MPFRCLIGRPESRLRPPFDSNANALHNSVNPSFESIDATIVFIESTSDP